jgi:hypothetical protein
VTARAQASKAPLAPHDLVNAVRGAAGRDDEPAAAQLRELSEDAYTRAVEHGSIAALFQELFLHVADQTDADGSRLKWAEEGSNVWEGLAVVAKYLERDSEELSAALDRINGYLTKSAAAKDGGR